MQTTASANWDLDIQRGPDWLMVKPRQAGRDLTYLPPLGDHLWDVLNRHLVYRVVVQLDEIDVLCSELIGQFIGLHRRVRERGGVLRLCGLSPYNQQVLRICGLVDHLPAYSSLRDAITGTTSCGKPR